jgi:hypothetical protein
MDEGGAIDEGVAQIDAHELGRKEFTARNKLLFREAPFAQFLLKESELDIQMSGDLKVFFDFEVAFFDLIEELMIIDVVLQMLIGEIKKIGDLVIGRIAFS